MKKTFVLLVLSVLLYSCEGLIKPYGTVFTVTNLPKGEVSITLESYVSNSVYKVDWGDGNTEDLKDILTTHVYDKNGDYVIKVTNKAKIGSKEGSDTQKAIVDNCSGNVVFYSNSPNSNRRSVYLNGKYIGSLTRYLVNVSVVPDCSWDNSNSVFIIKGLPLNVKYNIEVWIEGARDAITAPSITLTKNRQCLTYLNNY